jgi:tetrahydromethanopterin S-methyltransferase subunit F
VTRLSGNPLEILRDAYVAGFAFGLVSAIVLILTPVAA